MMIRLTGDSTRSPMRVLSAVPGWISDPDLESPAIKVIVHSWLRLRRFAMD
jgi:hypothetical protein